MRKFPTKAESLFWSKVRMKQFMGYKFRRQHILTVPGPQLQQCNYIADFYCSALSLVVEIDGEIHKKQLEDDQIRESDLRESGYSIIRFRNIEVLNNWESVEVRLSLFMKDLISRKRKN